jgi:hypothetical protein
MKEDFNSHSTLAPEIIRIISWRLSHSQAVSPESRLKRQIVNVCNINELRRSFAAKPRMVKWMASVGDTLCGCVLELSAMQSINPLA